MMIRKGFSIALVLMSAAGLAACGSDGGGDTAAFCDKNDEINSDMDSLDPTDPDGVKAILDALDEIEGDIPDDVKDEFATIKSAIEQLTELDASNPEAMLEALGDIDLEAVNAAGEALNQYAVDNC